MRLTRSFIVLALGAPLCATAQYIEKGTLDGVQLAYRWKHPVGKPSELHLRMKNVAETDRRIDVGIDLYYQGRTIESFEADTCLRPGMVLNGRVNGFYFVPQRLSTQQIKDGGADVEITRALITPEPCP
ncbi:MAG: hypothetical protein JNM49_05860 [Flavobacteriales bacterium]|nr:hypothetical protein [Flavobacteriales bacterium]